MLKSINPESVLFLDIETVPQNPDFNSLSERFQVLWEKKSVFFRDKDQTAGDVYQRAGIYAEFGKIICISVGIIKIQNGIKTYRIKSYFGDDEAKLIAEFFDMLNKLCSQKEIFLCAHNGKEFDYPYIARRALINGLDIPAILDTAGKKPWEVKNLDTLELWKFGDYKNYTSLDLLVAIFGIPSPKDDINGSQVAEVYWNEKNLERIVKYCEKDVIAIAQLLMKFKGEPLLEDSNIESVTFD